VDSHEVWTQLAALGCDAAQGYYLCRPLPDADLERWLRESPRGLAAQR
jgi:EAL domain-containing protein (putative c-di-GMP-specific phosphodiesterase class I)